MRYQVGDKILFQGCVFCIRNLSSTQYLLEFYAVVNLSQAFCHLMMGWEYADYVEQNSSFFED